MPRVRRRHRSGPLGVLALVAAGPVVVLACAKVAGIDGLEIGACKGGEPCFEPSSSASGTTSTPGTNSPKDSGTAPTSTKDGDVEPEETSVPFTCPTGTKGGDMVVAGPSSAPFCIDRTETSVAQYQAFLDSSPTTSSQPSECAWNTTYTPAGAAAPDTYPQVNVDWCDARAYCEWAGKRLCGKVSGGSLSEPNKEIHKPGVDTWFMACTKNGAQKYPYGDGLQSGACNLRYSDGGGPRARTSVGTLSACEGGYDGVFDMLGNVWEWVDDCFVVDDSAPENWACWPRGGSYDESEANVSCTTATGVHRRSGVGSTIGFRCCSK